VNRVDGKYVVSNRIIWRFVYASDLHFHLRILMLINPYIVQGKVHLEEATKAEGGSRGIALLFL
jgi:hypothetical protein